MKIYFGRCSEFCKYFILMVWYGGRGSGGCLFLGEFFLENQDLSIYDDDALIWEMMMKVSKAFV